MIKSLFLIICLFGSLSLDAAIIRRAAFDFGSGKIKVQVADVDTEKHEIINVIYSDSIFVRLSEDLAQQGNGKLSQKIQDQAFEATQKLKQVATLAGAVEFKGTATEAYRVATNAQDLISRYQNELSIPTDVISQDMEGKFGFLALLKEQNLDPNQTVCWDIGGGSFQITYVDQDGNIQSYKGPFGRSSMKNAIITHIKHKSSQEVHTPNPLTREEVDQGLLYLKSVLPPVPEELVQKLRKDNVRLIGISAHPQKFRELGGYTLENIKETLNSLLNKSDEEIKQENPNFAVTELILVQAILERLQIDHVTYIRTNSGSTSAFLTAEEFWHASSLT